KVFGKYSAAEITAAISAIPLRDLAAASVLTVFSYLVLCCYDLMALSYVEGRMRLRSLFFTAFTAYAFGNNIGLASVAGSSIRFRLYTGFGLKPGQILRIIAFVTTTFWLGFLSIAGLAMLMSPIQLPSNYAISASLSTAIGTCALLLAALYIGFCRFARTPFILKGQHLNLPRPGLALTQALTAAFDWALAASVLYFLLPHGHIGFFAFLSIFVTAQVIALITSVPGGVGVLEALVVYFMSANHEPTPAILGGLLVYRLIYYVIPLLFAAFLFAAHEIGAKARVRA
ncbi:MAG: lysylphosphatidylglycerol synthase domain-containing protein, partial [Bdellovibrionota bacterium]